MKINDNFAVYAAQRQTYLDFHRTRPGNSIHSELMRLAVGKSPDVSLIHQDLAKLDERQDCADFRLAGLLRLLYQFGDSPALDPNLRAEVEQTLVRFKYWPDEPGQDSMCSWSENHHILFASGGYLAGQLFPERVFENAGHTGREKMVVARPRVLRWLELRFKTGFSEWLSNVYYVEDIPALVNLIDFADDEEIVYKATLVLNVVMLDLALNHFHGTFGSTHGRSYFRNKVDGTLESTASVYKLLFGSNRFKVGNMSAVALALSPKYTLPPVIHALVNATPQPEMENRQRMGILLDEAEQWGLNFDSLEDGMVFLSLEAYFHPRTVALFTRMLDAFNWWDNRFFKSLRPYKRLLTVLRKLHLLGLTMRILERDVCRNTREEVNILTYRTPDYMLSCAQDYRKGYGGDQQHIWQATLGPDAVCFTTHPANFRRDGETPNYWTGSGLLPRAAQVKNVIIAIYDLKNIPALYVPIRHFFTHAWFPKHKFDDVIERDGWVFARKDQGYLALRSQQPYRWQVNADPREGSQLEEHELIVESKQNIWLCELGREAVDGTFEDFIARICAAELQFDGLNVRYHSPSQGALTFGWTKPLKQNSVIVNLRNYARYDSPYVQADFPAEEVIVRHGEHDLRLVWPEKREKAA